MTNQNSQLSRSLWIGLTAALAVACGGSLSREIAEPRHIPASSGAPDVVRVVDLGDMSSIPASGEVPTDRSDGVFVIGELVLVEGENFGKLPTLHIGGRPAERLARTKSGGILARIPVEVDAGKAEVEVSHPAGKHSISITVERQLALADSSSVQLVAVDREGAMLKRASLPIGGAVDLDFGHDGQGLYVLGPDSLTVIATAARGGPAVRARMAMDVNSPHGLVTRIGVPVLALLHGAGVTLFDTRVPTAITESGRVDLPNGGRAAVFSPDGSHPAVLSDKGNALTLIAIGSAPRVVASLDLMEGETVPLLQDLVFSPSGDEVWVLSGNNPKSVVAGLRPTKVMVVQLQGSNLVNLRAATISVAQGPRNLVVSQRKAVMAAAAVRSTRQRAAMVLSSVSSEMMSDGSKSGALRGKVVRFDLDGNATELSSGSSVFSQLCLSHKQSHVFAATRQQKDGARSLGITSASLEGGQSVYLRLADDTEPDALKPLPLAIAP